MYTNTRDLLNSVGVPNAALRRNSVALVDQLAITTGQTVYPIFTGTLSQFVRNLSFPMTGDTIFALIGLKLFVENLFTTTTDLIELMQNSYLSIMVGQKLQLNIPGAKILNFIAADTIGVSPAVANFNKRFFGKYKKFFNPIILNQSSTVQINFVTSSTAATDLNGKKIDVVFDALQSISGDPAFVYMPQQGNMFQDIDFTLWNTVSIGTANQYTFPLFTDNTLAPNKMSLNLPLPADMRFELQNIEVFFISDAVASQAETLDKIYYNRLHNQLNISVNQTLLYYSDIQEMINIITEYANVAFDDNAGTPVATDLTSFEALLQSKTLEIPVLFPATGLVNVSLTQPGSSLNNGELLTVCLNGTVKRTVN